ncbi:uncharacterized protein TNCV_1693301 [Trichonephila clavipes]|nr:uncharacterized protein TNCV_1693301 [Trichonephila clavipes]
MRERISCTSSRSTLTLPEEALLVKLYYQNGECASAALRSYRHTKGIRRGKGPLTNAAGARMISKFEATGCLDDRPRSGRPSTRRNAAETVKDEMETVAGSSMHGEVSARAVARRTGIPYTTVWLALRRTLRCYPYKIHRHHELLPGDSVNRRAFAVWAFQKMAEDDDWLSNLLWTDEAHFTLRGSVNTHNCRIWATENPRTVLETPLHGEKITVWVGFTTSTIIGPFFFEEMRDSGFVTATVTGERYADMLQNRIIPSLTDKHLLERAIFMQDGAPPHIARHVKNLLRRSFGDDRVLSRHFHHAWPPRSPDLSPCDYWLWGYLKSQVYRDRPTSLGMLKDNIRLQCLTITPDMLYSAVHNIIPRLQLLLRNDGEHIENFL